MRCEATKTSGERCKAQALTDGRVCSFHAHPERAAALGRKGGLANRFLPSADLKELPAPETAAETRQLVSYALVEVRHNRITPKIANAIAVLASVLLRAIEASDFDLRLRRVESMLEQKGRKTA